MQIISDFKIPKILLQELIDGIDTTELIHQLITQFDDGYLMFAEYLDKIRDIAAILGGPVAKIYEDLRDLVIVRIFIFHISIGISMERHRILHILIDIISDKV